MDNTTSPLIVRRATRSGIPPLQNYLSEAWRFRTFALHWSKADLKARNFDTRLGRIWHYLNPFLFGLIYFVFVGIVSGAGLGNISRLAFIVSQLYVWGYFGSIITSSVGSIQGGAGGITAQSSIPRIILPVASGYTATNLFLRSMIAYLPIHIVAGRTIYVETLLAPVLLVITGAFGLGLGMLFAVLNVYVRDTSRLLPHIIRLWMYLSPVVWIFTRLNGEGVESLARHNPMYPLMALWTLALGGKVDESSLDILPALLESAAYASVVFVVGFLTFVSKEDDFAIRN